MRPERRLLWAAFALLAFAYAFRPASFDLWDPNEPLRAQAAREMLRSGNTATLTLNGEDYFDKPPLWYWTVAALSWPVGDVTETTARMPSIFAMMGMFWLVAWFLRDRPSEALTAPAILLTSPMFLFHPYLGRAANMDALLCLLTTASIFAFWRGRPLVAGALCGMAILTKGPPGLVVPLIGFAAGTWAFPERRRWWAIPAAVGTALVVAGAWYIPTAVSRGYEFVDETLMKHIVQRVADPRSHQRPWWYFAKTLPMHFFPWVLMLPAALWAARRDRRTAACAVVVVATLVAFSLSKSKREIYIAPLFPFAAIVVAHYLGAASRRWNWALVGAAAVPAIALALVAAGAIPIHSEDIPQATMAALLADLRVPVAITAGVLLAAVAVGIGLRRAEPAAHALALCAFFAVAGVGVHQLVYPKVDRINSARGAGELVRLHVGPADRLYQCDIEEYGIVYYSDRHMKILPSSNAPTVLMNALKMEASRKRITAECVVVTRAKHLHLLHERAWVEPLGTTGVGSNQDLILVRVRIPATGIAPE